MRHALLSAALLLAGCAAAKPPPAVTRHHTHLPLDLAVDGDGYFIVRTTAGGFLFTRHGEFSVAPNGDVVNVDGYTLYSPMTVADPNARLTVSPDGEVRQDGLQGTTVLVGQIVLARFGKPDKLDADHDYRLPTDASGDPITGKPGTKGLGAIVSGELDD